MKILITGAKGFIGGHLAQFYKRKKHNVKLLDNFSHPSKNPIEVDYCDIRYYNDIAPYIEWCDVVFHLAAQIHVDKSIKNPEETIDTNVKGTLNVLEACRKYDKRLIFASTSEVYGTNQTGIMDEKHQLDAQSPYGASKVAADRLCKSYYNTYGTKVTILRNFNTFGPWQNDGSEGCSYGAVIGIFTGAALSGNPMKVFGDGKQERDYMYIDDCLKGYDLCLNNNKLIGEVINVGSGKTININDLAMLIKRIIGNNVPIYHADPRPGEVMSLKADISKAKMFGLEMDCDFERDLISYIDWYQQYGIT